MTPTTPADQGAPGRVSGWWFGLVALLPIACCALPLLVAAGVSASSGAVLGGVTGGVLMLAGVAAFVLWGMRRSARCHAENHIRQHPGSMTRLRQRRPDHSTHSALIRSRSANK